MGNPSELRDVWVSRRKYPSSPILIASPAESKIVVEEAVISGLKNGAISATFAAAITIPACRRIPWAKANLNHVAQSLIVSAAGTCGFFITVDKTILKKAKANSIGKADKAV